MAVLIEGVSVVIRCDAVVNLYDGGAKAFAADVPNQSLCADGELARVGFMMPEDARTYVEHLERKQLQYLNHDRVAVNIVVVDQRTGPCAPCDWLEFGRTHWNNDPRQPIAVCSAKPTQVNRVVVPNGWAYEKSLSAQHRFVDSSNIPASLRIVRQEGNLDVYKDAETGEEFFVARSSVQSN